MQETWVQSLGWEDSLEKEMATHSSTLALKIPWTEELGAGYYPWGRKESGTTERLHSVSLRVRIEDPLEEEMATHSSTLTLKIPWTEELGAGYCPWGHKGSGTTQRLHFLFTFLHCWCILYH